MSTNPQILLVVGIRPQEHKRTRIVSDDNDTQSQRITYHVFDSTRQEILEAGNLYDYLWYGSPMSSCPEEPGEIVGYIVDSVTSRDWVARALMHIPPCKNTDFLMEMPLDEFVDEMDMPSPRWRARKIVSEHRNVLNFQGSLGYYATDVWWQFAMYLLKMAGWDIERTDLRMYLIMDWA
jgi:hypothetical protein